MIVTRISDGLGNQMFQYAAARALSLRLGDRDLVLSMGFESDTLRRYELDAFQLPVRFPNRLDAFRMSMSFGDATKPSRRLARALLPFLRLTVMEDQRQGFDRRVADVHGSVYLMGHWQSDKYFADAADTIRRDFAFKAPPPAAVPPNAVAVHVRRGDYINRPEINRIHGVVGVDYYREAIAALRQRIADPHYVVFSDDPDWARSHLPLDGPATFVTGHTALQDLQLMTACRHFIIPNSTFSWWGAWLSTTAGSDKVVIAPRHWFARPDPSDRDKVPQGWITLDVQPTATT